MLSRNVIMTPGMLLLPFVMKAMERKPWFMKRTILHAPFQVSRRFIDPQGRPTETAGSDHYFQTCLKVAINIFKHVRPYVRPHFSKPRENKTNFK